MHAYPFERSHILYIPKVMRAFSNMLGYSRKEEGKAPFMVTFIRILPLPGQRGNLLERVYFVFKLGEEPSPHLAVHSYIILF